MKTTIIVNCFIIFSFVLFLNNTQASVLYVDDYGSSIEATIGASSSGDIIQLSPGTYYEHELWMKPNTTIRGSTDGMSIINGIDTPTLTKTLNGSFIFDDSLEVIYYK